MIYFFSEYVFRKPSFCRVQSMLLVAEDGNTVFEIRVCYNKKKKLKKQEVNDRIDSSGYSLFQRRRQTTGLTAISTVDGGY